MTTLTPKAAALALFAAALLALVSLTLPIAESYGDPISNILLNNTPIVDMLPFNDTLVYLVSSNEPALYLVNLDPVVRIAGNITAKLELPAEPHKLMRLSLNGEDYIAVLVGDNNLVVSDAALSRYWIESLPGKVSEIIALNDTIYALTTIDGVGNTIVALVPGEYGWSEARVTIGNMVANKLENLEPIQVLPIKGLDNIIILYSVKPTTEYSLLLKIMASSGNETIPASNAKLQIYANNKTLFLGTGVADINGTASIGLLLPPSSIENMIVFIEYNGTCYMLPLEPGQLIPLDQEGKIYTVKDVILLNETVTQIPVCPSVPSTYQIGLLKREDNGNFSIKMLNVEINSAEISLLDAYVIGGELYIWIAGKLSSIGGVEYSGEGFAYLKFGLGTLSLEDIGFYAYPAPSYTALNLPDGSELIIAGEQAFLASNSGPGYKLTWSVRFPSTIISYSQPLTINSVSVVGAAASNDIYLLGIANGTIEFLSKTRNLGIHIKTDINKLYITNKSIYIASNSGLIILDNIDYTGLTSIKNIEDVMLHPITLEFVDSYNKTQVCGKLEYELLAVTAKRNVTLIRESRSLCGSTRALYGPGLLLVARFKPDSPIYNGVVISASGEKNITIEVGRRNFTLVLIFVDTFTNASPERPLTLVAKALDMNYTTTLRIPAGRERANLTLPAGVYRIEVNDGKLYANASISTVLDADKTIHVGLNRIPVTVEIRVSTTMSAQPADIVRLTVETRDGAVLYETSFNSPEPERPVLVTFDTAYRGPAVIRVETEPGGGAGSPFYQSESIELNITDNGAAARITLKPILYRLTVIPVASDTRAPVNASIEIYSNGKLVASSTGPSAQIETTRGTYVIVVKPLPHPMYNVTVYAPRKVTVNLYEDVVLSVPLERVRFPVTIIVKDPYAPGNVTADDLEIIVDNITFAKLNAGEPIRPVKVLVAKHGSRLVVRPIHGIYEVYRDTLKPSNETKVIVINRKIYSAAITVINDVGSGVGGATLDITGNNVVYTTRVNTDNEGRAVVPLPYGDYTVCATAPGYYPVCTKLSVVDNVETSIVLKPQPMTLLLRYMPLIAAVIVAVVLIVIVRSYFRKVLERIGGEEEF